MKSLIAGVILGLMLALALHAAVEGTVVNRTTGKPQPGAAVTLLSMGSGSMAVKGTVTSDGTGRFRIDRTVDGPHLLQTVHQGVTYNRLLQPETPSSQVMLEVFDVSGARGAAKVLRHAVLLQPSGMDLSVRENILLRNREKVTLRRPKDGTFRFYIPDSGAESLRVHSRSQNGMPLQQVPAKTSEPGVYKLDLPLKPGDTQLDLSYTLPFRNPAEFAGRTLQTDVPVRLVVPPGVTLTGDRLKLLGQEPQSRASNYVAETPEYKVIIQAGAAPVPGSSASEEARSAVTQILPGIYDNLYSILGLAFLALSLGFVRLYQMKVAPVAQALVLPIAGGGRKKGKREAENALRNLHLGSLTANGQRGRRPAGAAR
jgi:hypothetical protein